MLEMNGKQYKIYNFNEIEKKYFGFIYITINNINNKKYVGKHSVWKENYIGSGKYLWNSIKKYGIENFTRYIIDIAESKEELSKKEEFYINEEFNAYSSKDWYNISKASDGGNTIAGYTEEDYEEFCRKCDCTKDMTEEELIKFRKKISESMKAKGISVGKNNPMYGSERFGELNPMYGKKHTEESKKKNSESNKGKQAGSKNPMYGKTNEKAREMQSKQIIVYKHGKIYREFPSILDFSKYMGSERKGDSIDQQVRKLVRGHVFKYKSSMLYGWEIRIKE